MALGAPRPHLGRRGPGGQLHTALLLAFLGGVYSHAYDSIIKPAVHTVYWHVSSDECTSVHALNISRGGLAWWRSPVGDEQTWSMQVTDKRVFYTLQSGPSVTAVSLDSGSIRWSWPERVGHTFWRRWDTDLPQGAQLATPLPAIAAQLLLLRAQHGSKVLALNMTRNGTLAWEFDALPNVTQAAADAGLGAPQQLAVDSWLLAGPNVLFISATAAHNDAPTAAGDGAGGAGDWPAATPQTGGVGAAGDTTRDVGRGDQADEDVQVRGWVLAVDLLSGALLWVSGPLEQAVAKLVLTEPTLLVTSVPDPAGSGWLYGLDKVTGALLYSLACGAGPCVIQVADTRVGLIINALQTQPPTLDALAAFELASGTWLWRGLPASTLAPYVTADCSAIATPRVRLYFACTCNAASVPRESFGPAGGVADREDVGGAVVGGDGAVAGIDTRPRRRPPPPRPVPRPEPGLCAFGVTTGDGKLVFEIILSPEDAVPPGAAAYGQAPLVLADVVAFTGRHGIYAIPQPSGVPGPNDVEGTAQPSGIPGPQGMEGTAQLSGVPGPQGVEGTTQPSGTHGAHDGEHIEVHHGVAAEAYEGMVAVAGAAAAGGVAAGGVGGLAAASGVAGAIASRRSQLEATQPPAPSLTYSFQLPAGLQFQAWDWLDLKAGRLVLQASPPPPPPEAQALQQAVTATRTPRNQIRTAATLPSSSSLPVLDPSPASDEPEGPSAWLFALDASNGTQLWSLATNLSLGPLTTGHVPPHDWARGGLLLVDGCRPPLDELEAGYRSARARTARAGGGAGRMRRAGGRPLADGEADEPWWRKKGGGEEPEGLGSGMSCCLYAVSLEDGHVAWQHCYDMGRACSSGLARDTATNIVYFLLATQVMVLVAGCVLGVIWNSRRAASAAANYLHDPDSDNEPLLVAVPAAPGAPAVVNYQQNGTWQHRDEDSE